MDVVILVFHLFSILVVGLVKYGLKEPERKGLKLLAVDKKDTFI